MTGKVFTLDAWNVVLLLIFCCEYIGADEIRNDLPGWWNSQWNSLDAWRAKNNVCEKECEFGMLVEEECRCECVSGWRSDWCDEKCIDTIGERYCNAYRTMCNETRYGPWLEAHCPATCNFCEKHTPASEGFVCGMRCAQPGGVLNEATCECECHTGWTGTYCQDMCFDTNERCPLWREKQCDNAVVLRNCPLMCGTCVKFGPGAPGFDCVNGGTLIMNENECRCECAPGWEGDQCEVLCDNHYELCEPAPGRGSYNTNMCLNHVFVREKCRKLCGTCEAIGPGSPGFECAIYCENGGTRVNNSTDCYCQCTPDWKGVTCNEPCVDVRERCERIIYACYHHKYQSYMQSKCAKTCGFCESDKDFGDHFTAHSETPRTPDVMKALRQTEEIPQYGAGLELGLLMDVSGSTGYPEWVRGCQLVSDYLQSLDYNADGGIRVGLIPFSTSMPISFNLFDSDSLDRIIDKLHRISFQGSRSEMLASLKAVKKKVFVHTRWQARCVLIVFTDGVFTGEEPFDLALELRNLGVEIYAISMNDIYIEPNLVRLTGKQDHVLGVLRSVSDLPNIY